MAREYKLQRSRPVSASGIDYAAALNEEQYRAVTSPPGKALVIAGAGSGKTRTLTYRVAWLLDQGEHARNILLLTFTNKAAREMIERVRDLVPRDVSDLWAGTFHSIGNRILRRHAEEIGFTKSFSILDRDDQKSLLNAVVAAMRHRHQAAPLPEGRCARLDVQPDGEHRRDPRKMCIARTYPPFLRMAWRRSSRSAPATRKRSWKRTRWISTTCSCLTVRLFRGAPGGAGALSEAFPPHPGGRVSGHELGAERADRSARRRGATA